MGGLQFDTPVLENELVSKNIAVTDTPYFYNDGGIARYLAAPPPGIIPHIFASTDINLPLVISVGRLWPARKTIRLADLWVPQGHALYIPPMPAQLGAECIDLHNNRNSALACWGNLQQNTILTETLLQSDDTYFYWYWNATGTVHAKP